MGSGESAETAATQNQVIKDTRLFQLVESDKKNEKELVEEDTKEDWMYKTFSKSKQTGNAIQDTTSDCKEEQIDGFSGLDNFMKRIEPTYNQHIETNCNSQEMTHDNFNLECGQRDSLDNFIDMNLDQFIN